MEHLHCSRHDSDLRQYRDSLGILELKRERAPFTSFCVSNRRRQWHPTPVLLPGQSHGWRWSIPLWGVLYNYYILCHFHLSSLRVSLCWRPRVVLFTVPDPIFCFSHSSVPSPAHLPLCTHPVHEEEHDIISWHCPLPATLSFSSPGNSFPLPPLFSHFSWCTLSPHTRPWNVHCFLWTTALWLASQGSTSVYQCTRSREGPMISIKGVAMSIRPHYARATSPGSSHFCLSWAVASSGRTSNSVSPTLTPDPTNQPAL